MDYSRIKNGIRHAGDPQDMDAEWEAYRKKCEKMKLKHYFHCVFLCVGLIFLSSINSLAAQNESDFASFSERMSMISKKIARFETLIQKYEKNRAEILRIARQDLMSDISTLGELVSKKILFWDEAYKADSRRVYYDQRENIIGHVANMRNAVHGFDTRLPEEFDFSDQLSLIKSDIKKFNETPRNDYPSVP